MLREIIIDKYKGHVYETEFLSLESRKACNLEGSIKIEEL